MTTYYVTIGVVLYFAFLAQAMRRTPPLAATQEPRRPFLFWVFVAFATATLALVSGLRWRVGTDYGQYAANYPQYVSGLRDDLGLFSEPGIRVVAWLSSLIRDDYATMFFLAAVITVGLNVATIAKWSDSIVMALMLYVLVGAWHGSFNGVRQYLAAAVVFAAHKFIVERRLIPYLAFVVLAGLFHVSAFAFILLYWVPQRRLRLASVFLLLAVAVAALYSSDAIIAAIETATEEDYSSNAYVFNDVNPLRIAVAVAPIALYLVGGATAGPRGWFYRNVAIVHAAVMVAASGSTYLARFGIYTTAFMPLAIPQLVKFEERWLTVLARVAVLLLFAYYWYFEVVNSVALHSYQTIFDRSFG